MINNFYVCQSHGSVYVGDRDSLLTTDIVRRIFWDLCETYSQGLFSTTGLPSVGPSFCASSPTRGGTPPFKLISDIRLINNDIYKYHKLYMYVVLVEYESDSVRSTHTVWFINILSKRITGSASINNTGVNHSTMPGHHPLRQQFRDA